MAVQIPEPPVATSGTATRTAAWPVIGHEAVIHALARDLAAQRLRHAYLFTGPAAIGKHTQNNTMKHGIQITTTQDGAWSVSQLVQKTPNGEFTRANPNKTVFIDYADPTAAAKLLESIAAGLRGKLGKKATR